MDLLYSRFLDLCKIKQQEIIYMQEVSDYLNPKKINLVRRTKSGDEINFDNSGRNILENYTYESLSDVINPYEKWFMFLLKRKQKTSQDLIDFENWSMEAEQEMFEYINDIAYYPHLIADKRNYDLFGFSGLSILTETDKLKIRAENPYNLISSKDSLNEDNKETYWVVETTPKTIFELFGYEVEEKSTNKHKVLYCLVPNSRFYVKKTDINKGRYVLVNYYLGSSQELDVLNYDNLTLHENKAIKIGKYRYFDDHFIVCPKDSLESGFDYGVGVGVRLLTGAQNLKQLRKNALYTASIESDPPTTVPYELYTLGKDGETKIAPGVQIPTSPSGERIETIPIRRDFGALITMLQYEDQKLINDVPQLTPPEKKARQSQFEIQSNQQRAGEIQLIYKLFYLMYGVSKHLDLIFKAGMKLDKITAPPKNFKKEEIKISLGNIILKLYKEAKSLGYVRALQLAQPYLTIYQEGIDNLKPDIIIRNIFKAQGAGDGLENVKMREEIRQQREAMLQQQQEQQIQLQQQQLAIEQQSAAGTIALQQAQADKLRTEG